MKSVTRSLLKLKIKKPNSYIPSSNQYRHFFRFRFLGKFFFHRSSSIQKFLRRLITMPPRKKPNTQSLSNLIAQQKLQQILDLIAQEKEEEEEEEEEEEANSDNQPLVNMTSVRRAKVKEANKRKTKDAVTKKRRKDGIDTPQSLPPRGKDQGRRKRLGDDTRGKIWESLAEHSRLVIREPTGTLEHDEED
ncbi:uncharacterized protein LOC113288195 [Papaver somniferum]|uniref:uncharacterized protein LOC113288195 n=1 Tax=Papaver somniferum TaxID=3469 RepID=UPI000E6FDF89|nr:uncharacterized protein LOC113288195 [Papaver somniferum]